MIQHEDKILDSIIRECNQYPIGFMVTVPEDWGNKYRCHYCGNSPAVHFLILGDPVVSRRIVPCCTKCAIRDNRLDVFGRSINN